MCPQVQARGMFARRLEIDFFGASFEFKIAF